MHGEASLAACSEFLHLRSTLQLGSLQFCEAGRVLQWFAQGLVPPAARSEYLQLDCAAAEQWGVGMPSAAAAVLLRALAVAALAAPAAAVAADW